MRQETARRIVDVVMIALLLCLAWWFVSGTTADAGIMSASEAELARDYAIPEPWWYLPSAGIVDLMWWLRKTMYILPPLV